MSRNAKPVGPLDRATVDVLRERMLARSMSLRDLVAESGLGLNRLGKVFRYETPPVTMGELAAIAEVFGVFPSAIVAEAEARVSDLDPTMYALAARADNDDDEAAAQQIDP